MQNTSSSQIKGRFLPHAQELGLSKTVKPHSADGDLELMKHLSTCLTNFGDRSCLTVGTTGYSPVLLDNPLMSQNWSWCTQKYRTWSRKSICTEWFLAAKFWANLECSEGRKEGGEAEDIESFKAARGSSSRHSLFWPGYLSVLIFRALGLLQNSFACLRWVGRAQPVSGRAAAQLQAHRWHGCSSNLSSLAFSPMIFFPFQWGEGRAAWISTCSKSKWDSPYNDFLILCASNLSSPRQMATAAAQLLWRSYLRKDRRKSGRQVWCSFGSPTPQKSRKKTQPVCRGEHNLEASPAEQLVVYQRQI